MPIPIFFKTGDDYEKAIEAYKEYITAYPDDASAYKNLGLVYKKIDNNELALFNFEKSYSKAFLSQ